MKLLKILGILGILLIFASPAMADWYFAATAQGLADGTSCANAYAYNDATNGINTSGKNAPGNKLYVCGTITIGANQSFWTPPNSGTSGNPITLFFENGAGVQSPYFSSNGGVYCNGKNYLTIDGNSLQGTMQNTANGSASLGYANQQSSKGLYFNGCSNVEVKNLNVKNIYVRALNDDSGTNPSQLSTNGIQFDPGSDNITVDGNVVTGGNRACIYTAYTTLTSAAVYNNTCDYMAWGIVFGDSSNASTASGITVYGNSIGPNFQAWGDAQQNMHNDGIFLFAVNTGSTITGKVYNNYVHGNMCYIQGNCTGFVFLDGGLLNVYLYNNLTSYDVAPSGGATTEANVVIRDDGNTPQSVYVFNNTILGYSGNSNGVLVDINATSDTCQIYNNIFNATHWAIVTGYAYTSISASDYNDFYGNTDVAQDDYHPGGGTTYATLSAWAASGAIRGGANPDTHSTAGNPNLSASPNYQPQSGSATIQWGTNLTSLSIATLNADAIGVARPTGTCSTQGSATCWDIGWKQFASTPPPTFNPGSTFSLVPPSNLRVVSIDGVPIAKRIPAAAERPRWALAYPWVVDRLR